MSFFCNSGCRSQRGNCSCNNSCTCTPVTPTVPVVAGTTTEEPQTVRALLNTVLDSCCTTDDVCREFEFSFADFPICDPEIGTALDVSINGDITYSEISRTKDDCACVSTARYNIPVRIYGSDPCGCCSFCLDRNITVIRSVKLCCTENSVLTSYNTRALAVSAVVSDITEEGVVVTLCVLFRSCLQQTMVREYTWTATPVCTTTDCNDARKQLYDPCDTVCGCVAGSTCPSC